MTLIVIPLALKAHPESHLALSTDSLQSSIADTLAVSPATDTISSIAPVPTEKIFWKDAIKSHRFNINDTTITYPKFLDFCVRVYRWGDRTFNSYDSTYVKPTGKNWKFMIKNNNWINSYIGNLSASRMRIMMNSTLTSSVGAQLAFMAVSYAYMFDISHLISGEKAKHKRMDFSFTCARFSLDFYMMSNSNPTKIHRFGEYKYKNRYWFTQKFNGLHSDDCYGIYGYYYFNHKKYAQAAAYCFSKLQQRSAGSFILGFAFDHQKFNMDFAELPDYLKEYLLNGQTEYWFRYNDYCVSVGYAYNWVFHKNWLLNVTATPAFGLRRSRSESTDGIKTLFSSNLRAKLALVYNRGRFFYGLHVITDGHWFKSSQNSLYSSTSDLTLTAGVRF